jgi:hypothetical protein
MKYLTRRFMINVYDYLIDEENENYSIRCRMIDMGKLKK